MKLLIISDIHANFPALAAVEFFFNNYALDGIINAGDSVVYAPFPNETLSWLRKMKVPSILGNTDKKVIALLKGKSFKKPRKEEKRSMYTWTANTLTQKNSDFLMSLPTSTNLHLPSPDLTTSQKIQIDIYHGSPARNHEFLFPDTPEKRFQELAELTPAPIIIVGHSHTPFHKIVGTTHFINPGSVGRMFDGNPTASCALLSMESSDIKVEHHRITYQVEAVVDALKKHNHPPIYAQMYREGRKLN